MFGADTQSELEECARQLAILANLDPDEPLPVVRAISAILGDEAILVVPMRFADAALVRVNGREKVAFRPGLNPHQIRFKGAHELGHLILRRRGYEGPHTEAFANFIAAAAIMPRKHFRSAHHWYSGDMVAIGDAYGVSESAAWLRAGEVAGESIALVTPRDVRWRGGWTADEQLTRRWARSSDAPPSVAKVRLRHDRKRVVLRVVGDELT